MPKSRVSLQCTVRGKTLALFQPSFQRFSGTNDTSYESPDIGRLESAKKLVMASS